MDINKHIKKDINYQYNDFIENELYTKLLAFSNDNKYVSISTSYNILIWDVINNKLVKEITIDKSSTYNISNLLYSFDNKYLICYILDNNSLNKKYNYIFIWETTNWNLIHKIETIKTYSNIICSPNSNKISYIDHKCSDEHLNVFNIDTNETKKFEFERSDPNRDFFLILLGYMNNGDDIIIEKSGYDVKTSINIFDTINGKILKKNENYMDLVSTDHHKKFIVNDEYLLYLYDSQINDFRYPKLKILNLNNFSIKTIEIKTRCPEQLDIIHFTGILPKFKF